MSTINDLATAAITASENSTTAPDGKRGAFVVLEGLDRSGKTTQVKLLEERFAKEGRRVKIMRFPGMFFLLTWGMYDSSLEGFLLMVFWGR